MSLADKIGFTIMVLAFDVAIFALNQIVIMVWRGKI